MTTRPEGRVVFAGELCCSGRAQGYNPSVSFADTSLYTREAFPLRRDFSTSRLRRQSPLRRGGLWANEGIGPYKVQKKIAGGGRTGSSAPTGCSEGFFTENS